MRNLGKLINRHRHANWALADQAVVSGSNFVTGIILARFFGPEVFGMFVLLQSVLLYVNSFQGALIFQPMMSAAPQLAEIERKPYLQGVFALQLMLSLALGTIVMVLAWLAKATGFTATLGLTSEIVFALICATLAFQLQDWQRRYYFVQEKASSAFLIDSISYSGQLTLFVLAYMTHRLDVANAFWIITAGSVTAFIVGFLRDRATPMFSHACAILREGWRTGRDYLAAWQFQWLGSQGIYMLGAGVVGTQAVGATRAAQNIVGPINILFLAMDNLVPVAAAKRYGSSGLPGLLRYLWRITLWGTVLLAPVLITLAVFSGNIIHVLYGEHYLAYASLVYWQATYVFVQFYLRQTFFFLRTVKATGVILRSGIIMSIISLSVTALTVQRYQENGLMLALLCGVIAGLVYSANSAHRIIKKMHQAESPVQDAPSPLNNPSRAWSRT